MFAPQEVKEQSPLFISRETNSPTPMPSHPVGVNTPLLKLPQKLISIFSAFLFSASASSSSPSSASFYLVLQFLWLSHFISFSSLLRFVYQSFVYLHHPRPRLLFPFPLYCSLALRLRLNFNLKPPYGRDSTCYPLPLPPDSCLLLPASCRLLLLLSFLISSGLCSLLFALLFALIFVFVFIFSRLLLVCLNLTATTPNAQCLLHLRAGATPPWAHLPLDFLSWFSALLDWF